MTPVAEGGRVHGGAFSAALRQPYMLAAFLALLLMGGDMLSVGGGGMNFRLVAVILLLLPLLQALRPATPFVLDRSLLYAGAPLVLAAFVSIGDSYSVVHSVGYSVWLLFTLLVVVGTLYNFARWNDPAQVRALWLWAFRLQALAVLLVEAPLRLPSGVRPHLWFYETSYLAVYMTGYFAAALYLSLNAGRRYWRDTVLALLTMATLFSATAIFGVLLATLLNVVVSRRPFRMLFWAGAGLLVIGVTGFVALRDSQYFYIVGGFLVGTSGDPVEIMNLILGRGGNRLLRALWGWDVFTQHWVNGIGIGADKVYTATHPLPSALQSHLPPWLFIAHNPFVNLFIEILGTMGVFGLVGLLTLLGYAVRRFRRFGPGDGTMVLAKAMFICFFSLLLVLLGEANFLRFYVWGAFGLGLGMVARHAAAHGRPFDEIRLTDLLALLRRRLWLGGVLVGLGVGGAVLTLRGLPPVHEASMVVVPRQSVEADLYRTYVDRFVSFEGAAFGRGDNTFGRYAALLSSAVVAERVVANGDFLAPLGVTVEGRSPVAALVDYLGEHLQVEGEINNDLIRVSLTAPSLEAARALLAELHRQTIRELDERQRLDGEQRVAELHRLAAAQPNRELKAWLVEQIDVHTLSLLRQDSEKPAIADVVQPPSGSGVPVSPRLTGPVACAGAIALLLLVLDVLSRCPGGLPGTFPMIYKRPSKEEAR